ncbi:MAG: hypothetical protein E7673_00865 [Ruminococcaceae bacterium]|nr:hypothetical protein [Oscillospiraceae bacterium]
MACKYPIILVHGLMVRHFKRFRAFGKIEHKLIDEGHDVYVATHDGFGSIETNAEQLRDFISDIIEKTGAEKVHLIAHSKGGLDLKYMIKEYAMAEKIATFTTLSTPHKGSAIASHIWRLPMWIKKIIAFFINTFYRILGDKHPNALKACDQLRTAEVGAEELFDPFDSIYCQSYSATLKRSRDCFIMALPHKIYKKYEDVDNDGMVSHESSKFGHYRGEILDISISHGQMVDFASKKHQKEKIYEFYRNMCRELEELEALPKE